jgi:hypothetical protein
MAKSYWLEVMFLLLLCQLEQLWRHLLLLLLLRLRLQLKSLPYGGTTNLEAAEVRALEGMEKRKLQPYERIMTLS